MYGALGGVIVDDLRLSASGDGASGGRRAHDVGAGRTQERHGPGIKRKIRRTHFRNVGASSRWDPYTLARPEREVPPAAAGPRHD